MFPQTEFQINLTLATCFSPVCPRILAHVPKTTIKQTKFLLVPSKSLTKISERKTKIQTITRLFMSHSNAKNVFPDFLVHRNLAQGCRQIIQSYQ